MSPTCTVTLPMPFPYQQEILNDPHRVKVPCLGRQAGKSLMGEIAAVDGHGPRGANGVPMYPGAMHGAEIYWVTKDYDNATKIWRDLEACLVRWGPSLDVSRQEKRIGFPSGGAITLRTGSDPDKVRGPTINGLIGDEVAFWHPGSLGTIRPALRIRHGWQFLISTPLGFNFFHEEWRRGDPSDSKRNPKCRSWRAPSTINPAFSLEELEDARLTEAPEVFAREYLAEFSLNTGAIFRRENFRFFEDRGDQLVPELGPPVFKRDLKRFLSADFALTKKTRSDYTAVGDWGLSRDGRLFLLDMWHGKKSAAEIPSFMKKIQDEAEAIAVYVEVSGPLGALNEECMRAGVRIREIGVHGKINGQKGWPKEDRAQKAAAVTDRGDVMLPKTRRASGDYAPPPWANDLIVECCSFPTKGTPDDRVDTYSWGIIGAARLGMKSPGLEPTASRAPARRAENEDEDKGNDRDDRSKDWLVGR